MSEKSPLSRRIAVSDIPPKGTRVRIEPNEPERAALAKFLKLPGISMLDALLEVRPFGRAGISVRGRLEAELTQTCVVTLEPFDARVDEEIEVTFVPEEDSGPDIEPGSENESNLDAPDILENGVADLGAIIVEHLVLGLDPYPRKPGVAFEVPLEDETPEGRQRPFEGLEDLLRGSKDDPKR
jgi:uncharacterized protein